jgi:hypothetical protein
MPYKIKTTLTNDQAQLEYNKYELADEFGKKSPILRGVRKDGGGNYVFDERQILNVKSSSKLNGTDTTLPVDNDAMTYGAMINMAKAFSAVMVTGTDHATVRISVRAVADSNLPLVGSLTSGQLVVDGVIFDATSVGQAEQSAAFTKAFGLVANSVDLYYRDVPLHSILLTGQTNPAENGLYKFNCNAPAPGMYALTRVALASSTLKGLARGRIYRVGGEGAVHGGTQWMVSESVADSWPYWPIPKPTGPTAFSFVPAQVDTTNNIIYQPSHGLATGQLVRISSTGTLPAPLREYGAAGPYYGVYVVSAAVFVLVDVITSAPVDLTSAGTGVHSLAIAGNPANIQSVKFTRMTLKKSAATIADLAGTENETQTATKLNEILDTLRNVHTIAP